MPTLHLVDGTTMSVSRSLARALAGASVISVTAAAGAWDREQRPVLVLVADNELLIVGAHGVRRWPVSGLERVTGEQIVMRGGVPLPILSWHSSTESDSLRDAVRTLLGQIGSTPAAVAPPLQAPGASGPVVWRTLGQWWFDGTGASDMPALSRGWKAGLAVTGAIVVVVFLAIALRDVDFSENGGDRYPKPPSRQACLRSIARQALPGQAAYWLGRDFLGIPLYLPSCGWSSYGVRHTSLSYQFTSSNPPHGDSPHLIVVVFTVPRDDVTVAKDFKGTFSRKQMPDGQDAILVFQHDPPPEIIRAARAALRPIPSGVTYPE